jgi:peptide/nickel transport system permease protein
VFYAFPSVLLAIAISGALGAGIINSIVSLTIVFIPPIVRVAESVTTSVRKPRLRRCGARVRRRAAHDHARARARQRARADLRLFDQPDQRLHDPAAGLSFLGLGTKPPEPEWGLMLNTLRTAIYVNPWVAALPAR